MGAVVFSLGKVAFAGIGIAVGCRLAADARRGGGVGLHTVALAALAIGGAGVLLMPLALALGSEGLSLAGEIAVRGGLLLLCLFVAGTFRPGPTGIALAGLCGALLVASLAWDVRQQPSLLHYDYTRASSHANQLAVAIPFAWSAVESGALWRRTRRRMRLGLGDPLVAERFLLWSLVTTCFVGICALAIAAGLASAAGASGGADLGHGLRGVLYFAIAGLVWRGMFATRRGEAGGSAARA